MELQIHSRSPWSFCSAFSISILALSSSRTKSTSSWSCGSVRALPPQTFPFHSLYSLALSALSLSPTVIDKLSHHLDNDPNLPCSSPLAGWRPKECSEDRFGAMRLILCLPPLKFQSMPMKEGIYSAVSKLQG